MQPVRRRVALALLLIAGTLGPAAGPASAAPGARASQSASDVVALDQGLVQFVTRVSGGAQGSQQSHPH